MDALTERINSLTPRGKKAFADKIKERPSAWIFWIKEYRINSQKSMKEKNPTESNRLFFRALNALRKIDENFLS